MRVLMMHEDVRAPGAGGGAESLLRDEMEALSRLGHEVRWWYGENALENEVDQFKPDICHVSTIHTRLGLHPVRWLQRQKVPHVWALMDYWPFCGTRMLLKEYDLGCSAVEGVCDEQCTGQRAPALFLDTVRKSPIVALNAFTADIYRRNGIPVTAVVELGVDTKLFRPELPLRVQNKIICATAWPKYPTKGVHILREALKIAGLQATLIAGVSRQRLASEFRTGAIFVFPSCYQETWGLCLTEAMASGMACIASAVAGPRAQIASNGDGLLVPPRSPQALADALTCLTNDQALQRRLGAAARDHVVKDHSLEAMGKRWEALYSQILARS
jgi:glycosyltransferase involved in cell wall biosynthesis